jgi:hypothetical protein
MIVSKLLVRRKLYTPLCSHSAYFYQLQPNVLNFLLFYIIAFPLATYNVCITVFLWVYQCILPYLRFRTYSMEAEGPVNYVIQLIMKNGTNWLWNRVKGKLGEGKRLDAK